MSNRLVQFPLVYNFDVRIWLRQLSNQVGRAITLSEVPDSEIEKWSAYHVNAIWPMGIWQTGEHSRLLALNNSHSCDEADWKSEDVVASPYSIADYHVAEAIGGEAALAELRKRLAKREINLILDFVPNHTAPDHPWVRTQRDFYISIPDGHIEHIGEDAFFSTDDGTYLACGRDPNLPPFRDTLQLNFANADLRAALIETLRRIATQCDGVRCDLAMLMLKDVFNRTWGDLAGEMRAEFWDVAITEVKKVAPQFLLLAEAYWGTEWHLQRLGFDFTYDKTLYDRILGGDISGVKAHLTADWDFARKLVRFTENHDEARAAAAFGANNKAASLLTLTLTGLRLMHNGQREGFLRRPSLFSLRRPEEEPNPDVEAFYDRLLEVIGNPAITRGDFRLRESKDDGSEAVIAFERCSGEDGRIVCAINLTDRGSEVSFDTDAFAHVKDYRDLRIVSTEQARSPQVDLWPGGVTMRLRAHEGLLFVVR